MTEKKPGIGFIGTGVMGRSMAGHLLAAGYPLHVHTRTRSKAEELIENGATWHETPGDLAPKSEIVFTIVGFPRDVAEVYLGADGLLARSKPGTVLVDMTTSSPALAERIAAEAEAKGCFALDAPVSGGDVGAREARLSIMVGGAEAAYERVLPLLRLMGANIVRQGGAGSGQRCKLCNQIAIAGNVLGVCEAMAYARRSGLDPATVLRSISAGAAGSWSLSNMAPRMLAGDFAAGFFVKHFIKDMDLALESARELGLPTPALELALERYRELAAAGHEDDGTQGLFRLYDA